MKLRTRIITAVGLLLTALAASGHSGHEALGNGLHIEYVFAVGAISIVAIYALIRQKKNEQD